MAALPRLPFQKLDGRGLADIARELDLTVIWRGITSRHTARQISFTSLGSVSRRWFWREPSRRLGTKASFYSLSDDSVSAIDLASLDLTKRIRVKYNILIPFLNMIRRGQVKSVYLGVSIRHGTGFQHLLVVCIYT